MSDKGGEKASLVRKEGESPAAQASQNKGAPCVPCCHKGEWGRYGGGGGGGEKEVRRQRCYQGPLD